MYRPAALCPRTRLLFMQESFADNSLRVELKKGRLVIYETGYGHYPQVRTLVIPPPERWAAFWQNVDAIGVWKWKSEYY